ncbi:MAG: YgjV family protein [Oscillospiraceae bacterium]|nr:YgjV family protein [Oscillospiraceae bacterium]
MNFIIAQVLGFIGLTLACIGIQYKKKKHILLFNIFTALFFMVHYVLLGATTAAAVGVVGVLKFITFYYKDARKEKLSKKIDVAILVVFLSMNFIIGVVTYKNLLTLLPVVAGIMRNICNVAETY